MSITTKRIPPSLVQLSINTAIKYLNHIRDVGDTDITLLKEILNECTADQLSQIEKASSKRTDLSSVTDGIWNRFYIQRFGTRSARQEIMMLKLNEAPSISWKQIFYTKLKEVAKAEKKSKDKMKREILKEATVGKLKKSFKKAYKKMGIDAVFNSRVREEEEEEESEEIEEDGLSSYELISETVIWNDNPFLNRPLKSSIIQRMRNMNRD